MNAAVAAASGRNELTRVALARLQAGLPDYLRLTGDHLYCLWTMWATDKSEKVALAGYIDDHKPLPFADSVLPYLEKSRTPPFPRLVRAVTLTIASLLAIASFLLLGAIISRRPLSLELKFSGICGIITHAGLLVSALGSVGIPRYTIGVWPPLEIGILFFAAWAGHQITQHKVSMPLRAIGARRWHLFRLDHEPGSSANVAKDKSALRSDI